MNSKDNHIPLWGLAAFSWLISFYFLIGFSSNAGFPPKNTLSIGEIIYLSLWLFFLFLPYFNKIKIGKFLELEREISDAKQELSEFKTEIRNNISVLSTNINTIGNLSNQVTVNFPVLGDLEELKQKVDELSSPNTQQEAEDIRNEILLESEDKVMALARTRIRMEYLLRKILGKQISLNALRDQSIKFLGLRSMFKMFIRENPQYEYLSEPFSYVNQICNAAIHAQKVPEEQASEALDFGARILAVLHDTLGNNKKE